MKVQSGRRGIALNFLQLGARWGVGVNATSWPLYPWERDSVPILQEVGWAAWPVWTGAENLVPTPHRNSIPETYSPQQVGIPTELSLPTMDVSTQLQTLAVLPLGNDASSA
jgi:hypothetical protein